MLGGRDRDRRLRDPRGADVLVSQYATHRYPRFWPDAGKFGLSRVTPNASGPATSTPTFPFGGRSDDVRTNGSQLTASLAVNGPRSRAGLDAAAWLVDSNG